MDRNETYHFECAISDCLGEEIIMAIITISSDCGTESEKVASQVAKKLGYEYIGNQLISEIARELKVSESEAEMFRKTSQSRILRFVDRYTCSIVQRVVDREQGCLDDGKFFDVTKRLVEKIYDVGNAIIIGWGGQCLLKGKPNTLHVRLTKEESEKIKTVMAERHLDEKAARAYIDREEGDLRAYMKQYFHEDWDNARLYDLIIDMGKISADQAVDLICDNIKYKTS